MTETPALDRELLEETLALDPQGLRELIDLYFAQAAETLAGLETAIAADQAETVNHLAHRLAGASAVCGVNAMVGPLRLLEQRGREGQLADAAPLMASLSEQLERCRRLLDEYLAEKEGTPNGGSD